MELAGLEPATSWCDSGAHRAQIVPICRELVEHPPRWAREDARRLQVINGSLPPKSAVRGQTLGPK
jgi:hypothetical protein